MKEILGRFKENLENFAKNEREVKKKFLKTWENLYENLRKTWKKFEEILKLIKNFWGIKWYVRDVF